MVIVAGHLVVAAARREAYLDGCREVVRQARASAGCLDFVIAADPLDETRVNVFERWQSRDAVGAFRGSGPDDDQQDAILSASVAEYDVAAERPLT